MKLLSIVVQNVYLNKRLNLKVCLTEEALYHHLKAEYCWHRLWLKLFIVLRIHFSFPYLFVPIIVFLFHLNKPFLSLQLNYYARSDVQTIWFYFHTFPFNSYLLLTNLNVCLFICPFVLLIFTISIFPLHQDFIFPETTDQTPTS